MNHEAVTVVIPTKNRWPLLRVALATVLGQRGVAVHAVVVDDGSEDRTPTALAAITDSRVTVIRNASSLGVSAARNAGLARVRTSWVGFLDDDDVWGPDHLALQLSTAQGHASQPGLIYAGVRIETDANREPIGAIRASPDDIVTDELLSENVVGPPSAVLLRTDVVRRAGGFDPNLSILADWDMWIAATRLGSAVRADSGQVGYMRHADNMHLAGDRFAREMTYLRKKHAHAAAARGRRLLGDTLPLHVAAAHRKGGRRVRASAWYLRSFAGRRHPRDLLLAAGVLLGERAIDLSGLKRPPGGQESPGDVPWLHDVRCAQKPDDMTVPDMLWGEGR